VLTSLIEQFGINSSYFIQVGVFLAFIFLSRALYFKPFAGLLEARHQALVKDAESAQKMIEQAQTKLAEYQRLVAEARTQGQAEVEKIMNSAKAEESKLLQNAREEVKREFNRVHELIGTQKAQIRKELESQIEAMASEAVNVLLAQGKGSWKS
jgi:F-type H+-transporting ATPase subunit b